MILKTRLVASTALVAISTFVGVAAADTAATADGAKPAAAGKADASAKDDVEKVVVTAQKRSQKLKDVPLPVQSISKTQLENSGAADVADLVTQIPGASVVSKSTPGFETVQIRGISSGTTGDGLVGYYVDETPFGIPNLQLSPPARLLDVSRVEVIRGPSGTLYGQGSMGGTIKLITATPDSTAFYGTVRGEISATKGGGTNYYGDLVLNMPLIKNELALRFSGSAENLSGFAELPLTGEKNVNEFRAGNSRLTLGWTPTENFDVTAMYWHIDNAQDFSNGLTTTLPVPSIGFTGGVKAYTDVRMDVYSATVNLRVDGAVITSNTSVVEHELDFEAPLFGVIDNDSNFQTHSLTQELRVASNTDSNFQWLAGVFYRDATIDSDICLQFIGLSCSVASFANFNIVGPLDTKSFSLFGEGSLSMFDGQLEALVGLRYFEDQRGGRTTNRNTLVVDTAEAEYNSWSPRFNLKYKPAEEGQIYVNVAKGFRSGTLQTQAQVDASIATGVPTSTQIQPDHLWTYELGTKWQLFDNTVFFEGSIYQTKWKGIQTQFTTAAVISVANAGDATINGADIGVTWRTPVDGLSMQFVGSMLDTEFDRVAPALAVSVPSIAVGKSLPNVPESYYTISANYSHPQEWLGGLTGNAYVAYAFRDSQIDASTGAVSGELNDLTLCLGVEGARWKAEAFVMNALNDDDPAVLTPAALSYQIMYPRRMGLMMSYSF